MDDHQPKTMECPLSVEEVDLFGPGAAEQWYAAYDILHEDAPVLRLPGEGRTPEKDAFILTKHEDISLVVKNWERFPPSQSLILDEIRESGKAPHGSS